MNGSMDTVSWVFDYGRHDFFFFLFGIMVFGGWLKVDVRWV